MVDVFNTTIQEPEQAQRIASILKRTFPRINVTVDLDQCENILRVEGPAINSDQIIATVNQAGFGCEVLEDRICISTKQVLK